MPVDALDRRLDDLPLVRVERLAARREPVLQPLRQEGAVHGRVRQRQGIEPARFAQRDVGHRGAAGAREDLAAVLVVEVEDPRIDPLRLREEQVEQGRFPPAGRSGHEHVAGRIRPAPGVEIQEVRRLALRLQDGDRLAPPVAVGSAAREVVQAREPREVRGRDAALARHVLKIPRQLRPEAGFEIQRLAHGLDVEVDEAVLDGHQRAVQRRELIVGRLHQHRQVMPAHRDAPRGHVAHGVGQIVDLVLRLVLRLVQALLLNLDFLGRSRAVLEMVGLRDDHLDRQVEEPVEHVAVGHVGVLLDAQKCPQLAPRPAAHFHRLVPEDRAVPAEVVPERHARHANFGILPVHQVVQEAHGLRIPALVFAVHAKQLRLVGAEGLQNALRHVPQLLRAAPAPVVELLALPLVAQIDDAVLRSHEDTGLVGKLHERHVDVVDILLASLVLPSPRGVKLGAEPVGEPAFRVLEMLAPDDVHRDAEVALGARRRVRTYQSDHYPAGSDGQSSRGNPGAAQNRARPCKRWQSIRSPDCLRGSI